VRLGLLTGFCGSLTNSDARSSQTLRRFSTLENSNRYWTDADRKHNGGRGGSWPKLAQYRSTFGTTDLEGEFGREHRMPIVPACRLGIVRKAGSTPWLAVVLLLASGPIGKPQPWSLSDLSRRDRTIVARQFIAWTMYKGRRVPERA
jgi:hypothetical protein